MSGIDAFGLGVKRFRFLDRAYDPGTGEVSLSYAFDDAEPLVERLVFPHAPWPVDPSRQAAFLSALDLLHLVAGVSYYKACVPPELDPGPHALDPRTAGFLQALYVEGLAEFAWVNGIELDGRFRFAPESGSRATPLDLDLPERALLAVGGGKDSLVSLDLLVNGGIETQPICVGPSPLIADTVRRAGLPLLRVQRKLAPGLQRMNEAGALNGHVPVTAIHSAILLCAALLYGFRWVVFSNERSADEPTRRGADGRAVNHQYSKSLSFERAFQDVVRETISAGVDCFSLLRPLTELAIARRFAGLTHFHDVFSSCNRNFHQDGSRLADGRWCGDCPKCRFVTLALAAFMEPGDIVAMMGRNLLDDAGQADGFRDLCGLGGDKPFECVGGIGECRAALAVLAQREQWSACALVALLAPELAGVEVPDFKALLTPEGPHCIPEAVAARVGL